MSTEDDADLPVLTQVLRTGSGLAAESVHHGNGPAVAAASVHEHFDVLDRPDADPSWPRALVIGSDAASHDEGRIDESNAATSIHDAAVPPVDDLDPSTDARTSFASITTIADPRRIDLRDNDVFLRSAPTDDAFAGHIDEPPLVARGGVEERSDASRDASSRTIGHDVPLVFRDPSLGARDHEATFALRVRDSVLEELSARIDTELDARIAQTLHAQLETALAHLQTGLRAELGEALRDVVGHAVDDAVRRLRRSSPSDDGP